MCLPISDKVTAEVRLGMNSTCRSIDLAINMIAPIAVGQIMFFVSHIVAAIVIAAWNVISFFIEYFLLWNIYKDFPNLKLKNIPAVSENLLQGIPVLDKEFYISILQYISLNYLY